MAVRKGLLAIAACLLSGLAFVNAAWAQDWQAQSVEGAATLTRPGAGAAEALQPGAAVPAGAEVKTAAGARVVLTRGGDRVTVSPESSLKIEQVGGPGMGDRLLQALGTALFQVEKRPDRQFEVKTPYLAAVVKGTTFTVSVRSEGAAVHVTEGAVQVGRLGGLGAPVLLRPGQTGSVSSQPGSDVQVMQRQSAAPAPAQAANDGPAEAAKAQEAGAPAARAAEAGRPAAAPQTDAPAKPRAVANAITAGPGNMLELTKGLVGNVGGSRERGGGKSVEFRDAPVERAEQALKENSGRDKRTAGAAAETASLGTVPSDDRGSDKGAGHGKGNNGNAGAKGLGGGSAKLSSGAPGGGSGGGGFGNSVSGGGPVGGGGSPTAGAGNAGGPILAGGAPLGGAPNSLSGAPAGGGNPLGGGTSNPVGSASGGGPLGGGSPSSVADSGPALSSLLGGGNSLAGGNGNAGGNGKGKSK